MRDAALNNIAVLSAIYIAVLVWAMQHVADHYTPKLLSIFFHRVILGPLVLLGALFLAAGILVLRPVPHTLFSLITGGRIQLPSIAGDIVAFILLIIAIIVVLYSTYQMVYRFAHGTEIIDWLRERPNQDIILQEILLNAIPRSDQQITSAALRMALCSKNNKNTSFISWLSDHRDLIAIKWMTLELLNILLSDPFDKSAADAYRDLLCVLLAEALEKEDFPFSRDVLSTIMGKLAFVQPWTQSHAQLLYNIGFTLWQIGERGDNAPRTARIPQQLEDTQLIFLIRLRKIWYHLLKLGDPSSVEDYSWVLGDLAIDTAGTESCESFISRLYDVMEDGFRQHLLTPDAIQQMASDLGTVRIRAYSSDDQIQEWIDLLLVDLLAMLAELGEDEEALGHVVGNGYMTRRTTKKGKWPWSRSYDIRRTNHSWLKPESYKAAAKALEIHKFQGDSSKYSHRSSWVEPEVIAMDLRNGSV